MSVNYTSIIEIAAANKEVILSSLSNDTIFAAEKTVQNFRFGNLENKNEYMVINSNVGIGSTAPTCTLDIHGKVFVDGDSYMNCNLNVTGYSAFSNDVIIIDGKNLLLGSSSTNKILKTDTTNSVMKNGIQNITSSSSGTISFNYTFSDTPNVVITLVNSSAINVSIVSISNSSFTWTSASTITSGSINWIAIGTSI